MELLRPAFRLGGGVRVDAGGGGGGAVGLAGLGAAGPGAATRPTATASPPTTGAICACSPTSGSRDVRLCPEWARLEPENGRVDPWAVEHYQHVFTAAVDAGLRPWIALVDRSLPGWFGLDERGFRDRRARSYFWPRHVERCAELFGEWAHAWVPIVAPFRLARAGYLTGTAPPGRTDAGRFLDTLAGLHLGLGEAWRVLRGGAPVADRVRRRRGPPRRPGADDPGPGPAGGGPALGLDHRAAGRPGHAARLGNGGRARPRRRLRSDRAGRGRPSHGARGRRVGRPAHAGGRRRPRPPGRRGGPRPADRRPRPAGARPRPPGGDAGRGAGRRATTASTCGAGSPSPPSTATSGRPASAPASGCGTETATPARSSTCCARPSPRTSAGARPRPVRRRPPRRARGRQPTPDGPSSSSLTSAAIGLRSERVSVRWAKSGWPFSVSITDTTPS